MQHDDMITALLLVIVVLLLVRVLQWGSYIAEIRRHRKAVQQYNRREEARR